MVERMKNGKKFVRYKEGAEMYSMCQSKFEQMAKARKDNKGRALRKGESQRTDKTYVYTYTDPFKKRRFIYARDLQTLREKEADLIKNQLDGLDVYVAGSATLNYVFDRYMSTKYDLRRTTRSNYNYMYDHFVRESFGQRKIEEIKYSDVMYFYYYLLNEKELQANTVDTIHRAAKGFYELYRKQSNILPLASIIYCSLGNRLQDWGSNRVKVGRFRL